MALGSSMLETMRAESPQWMQVLTSMPNTRLRRCAMSSSDGAQSECDGLCWPRSIPGR